MLDAGRRFARWGLGPARPTAESWTAPIAELAAGFDVAPGDLGPDHPPAQGRRVAGEGVVRAELSAELGLDRWRGMPCAERATGVVRSTATYQPDQPWPAEQADVGSEMLNVWLVDEP